MSGITEVIFANGLSGLEVVLLLQWAWDYFQRGKGP